MKVELKDINWTRTFIGLVLMTILVLWIYLITREVIDFKYVYNKTWTIGLGLKLIFNSRSFLIPLITIIAIIGFFIPSPVGWILSNNFFLVFLFYMLLVVFPASHVDWYYYLIGTIPVGLVLLMNSKKTLRFYKVNSSGLLTIHLILIITGLTTTLLAGYFYLNPGENYIDIINNY